MERIAGLRLFCRAIVSLGPLGYVPASGSVGSLVALLAWFFLPAVTSLSFFSLFFFLVYLSIAYAVPDGTDHSWIIIDEVLGMLVACTGFSRTLPFGLAAFFLFRFFDIYKPLGIKKCEQLPGALGIIGDDLLAAFVTQLIIRIGIIFLGYVYAA